MFEQFANLPYMVIFITVGLTVLTALYTEFKLK